VCPACGQPVRSAKGCRCRDGVVATENQKQSGWQWAVFEASIERRFRLLAYPLTLLVFWGLVHAGFARMLVRTTLSMWNHEIGHALAAWLCGRFAFPGPWFTPVAERRSWLVILVVAALLGWGAFRLWSSRRAWALALLSLFPVQIICTFLLSDHRVRTFIIWSGDGGCMLLGTLMMLSFYAAKNTQIRVGWLRWGFLIIGAAALTDPLATWWAARTDAEAIPFGENEGNVLSDPTVLVFQQGISIRGLVNSYLFTAGACFLALLVAYVLGLRRHADTEIEST
jgi:hypothetical protein